MSKFLGLATMDADVESSEAAWHVGDTHDPISPAGELGCSSVTSSASLHFHELPSSSLVSDNLLN
jgi:hypothetical protein